MEKDEKDVKDSSSKSKEAEDSSEKDSRGVPWKNVAEEFKRKYEGSEKKINELASKMEQLVDFVSKMEEAKKTAEPSRGEEPQNVAELRELAEKPRDYISRLIEEHEVRREAKDAATWLESQEGYKSEYAKEIHRIIIENGLGGPPKKRAELAWMLLKQERKELQPKVESDDSRDKELRRFQVEGPGRPVVPKPSGKKKELLEKLSRASTMAEQQELVTQISRLNAEEKSKSR